MSDDLQFDRAEMSPGLTCRQCQAPLRDHYFQAQGVMLCDQCADGLRTALVGKGSSAGRFTQACLLGAGAALLGGIGYGLFIMLAKAEFALVTIAMGWLVGKGVRRGSGGRGGWRYGLLAVLLTYAALSLSYMIVGIVELREHPKQAQVEPGKTSPSPSGTSTSVEKPASPSASSRPSGPSTEADDEHAPISAGAAILALLGIAFASPVMVAMQSPLSGLISGFGLWQAWKMNGALNIEITGPHMIGSAGSAPSRA